MKDLPNEPGVYLFYNENKEIIYIGKAKSLRSRVKSYFRGADRSVKTVHLAKRIDDVDFIIVHNEVEALLLENRLIKKHKPRYNIRLKDSKTYAYIKITDEKFPRVLSTRRVTKKGTFFGPYTDGSARFELVKLTNGLFKLRTQKVICKKACLNYHLGLCSGPCVGKVTPEQYREQIEGAKRFLQGQIKPVLKQLREQMQVASNEKKYEIALEKKKQIDAIQRVQDRQRVDLMKRYDQDVIALVTDGSFGIISLFHIKKGVISSREEHRFEMSEELLREFVLRYYQTRQIPREVVLSDEIWLEDEKTALEEYLGQLRKGAVTLVVPQRGDKRALVELAIKNARQTQSSLTSLKAALNLAAEPKIIECFDISNFGREHIVAGMARFIDGKPDKSGYRRFEIRTVIDKQDDFTSMQEAVFRRYKRLKDERKELPDLVLIDGGKGQLQSARKGLQQARVDVLVVSLAKKEEILHLENRKPLKLDASSPIMLFLRGIRDRTHRFAISYNRQKRSFDIL